MTARLSTTAVGLPRTPRLRNSSVVCGQPRYRSIFPLIEQMRRQAIERYGSRFRMPVLLGYGQRVNDPYELEITMVRRIVSGMRRGAAGSAPTA